MELMPYQLEGAQFCLDKSHAMIGDEMGLGKTIQAIEVVNQLNLGRILVVCPASLKLNWRREMLVWLRRYYDIGVVEGGDWPDSEVVIINYDILGKHASKLLSTPWDLIIFDECHYLKNPKAKRTIQALKIPTKKRIFLTGTPIVNRPIELFPILKSCFPQDIESYWWYAKKFCNAYQTRWGWDVSGASNIDLLNKSLKKFMIRRLKKDVLTQLPSKTRQIIDLPANPRLLKAENSLLSRRFKGMDYESVVGQLEYDMISFSEMAAVRHETALAKVPSAIEYIKGTLDSQDKIVVFGHHRDVVAQIYDAFSDMAVMVHGGTSMANRQAAVDMFQKWPDKRIFVGNIQAAGVGITLTAASCVIFVELDWVPGNMTQAEDRCHRIGQKSNVLIQHLVLDGSLDAYMARVLISKQATLDKILN